MAVESLEFEPLVIKIVDLLSTIQGKALPSDVIAAATALQGEYKEYVRLCRRAHVVKDPEPKA